MKMETDTNKHPKFKNKQIQTIKLLIKLVKT